MKAKFSTHLGVTKSYVRIDLGDQLSRSRAGHLHQVYVVGEVRCTCEDNTFRPHKDCEHIRRELGTFRTTKTGSLLTEREVELSERTGTSPVGDRLSAIEAKLAAIERERLPKPRR